ncbi:response regulator [Candidatus Peregrinibacteria bacterium]|jgi:CheY-like chemotaxis protein|nr:response regulator [Candidatus Peregrinibacteria bacterium]
MLKVLIIEDELLIQKSLKILLERKSAQVVTASSGKTAIDIIHREHFDRIICDLMLQDITGFDVFEESKKVYTKEELMKKFIFITAYSSQQVSEQINNYGCRLFTKPFDDINLVVDTFLTNSVQEVEIESPQI